MTVIEDLNTLEKQGIYDRLVKKGVIPLKVNQYLEMYNYYNKMLVKHKKEKSAKIMATKDTCAEFQCCRMTVDRAIKFIEA